MCVCDDVIISVCFYRKFMWPSTFKQKGGSLFEMTEKESALGSTLE